MERSDRRRRWIAAIAIALPSLVAREAIAAEEPTEGASRASTRTFERHKSRFDHGGFTVDAHLGTQGCIGRTCRDGMLEARPGFRFDGFLGGNIKGYVDLGVAGGWGTLTSKAEPGTNVLSLYGVDHVALQEQIMQTGAEVDLSVLDVQEAKLRTAQFGPRIRVHLVPWGRFLGFIGTGVEYNLFRGKYQTRSGPVRIDFHGLAVPVELGFGVFVHEHVAVVSHFNYRWTWHGLAVLKRDGQTIPAPVRYLERATNRADGDLAGSLPQLWSLTFGLRVRV